MDGGFEGQTATLLGSTIPGPLSSTSWSVSSTTNSSVRLMINNPALARTGNKFASHSTTSTTVRLQSPTTATVSNAPIAGQQYTVQYYYKTTTDPSANLQGSIYNDATNSKSGLITSTYQSGVWTKGTYTPSAINTAPVGASLNFAAVRYLTATTSNVLVDDFVVYAGPVDTTLPDVSTTASVSNLTATNLTLSWAAPSTGVDGGGYMVVRYATNPNADNVPNANGIYTIGNTITNGTGSLSGTVVYIGTGTSCSDSLLTSGATYYYKIFTVDKAFNYSVENLFSVTTLTAPIAPIANVETAVSSTGFTANWNSVSGATSYNFYLYGAGITQNIVGWTFPNAWTAAQGITPLADIANANNTTKVITQSAGTVTAGEGSGGVGTFAIQGTSWYQAIGKNWEIQANTIGYKNIKITSKIYSTAPRDFKLQYKIGLAGTYADVPGGAIVCSSDWGTGNLYNLVLPSECENQTIVCLRWINYTAIDFNTGTNLTGGTVRLDDILVTGSLFQAVAGYPINVAGNSTVITGLNPGSTYFYEVNASNGSASSLNSNQITAYTKTSQDLADFRTTTSGNFSSASVWEWNDGTGVWIPATQAPTSTNNILIVSGHEVTMVADFNVGSNKVINVNGTINLAGKNISGLGAFILNAGASIKLGENVSLANGITTTNTTFNSGANYFLDGTTVAQTTTAIPSGLTGNMTVSNPMGVTLSQSLKVNVTGTLLVTSTGKIIFGNGTNIITNLSGTGSFIAQSGSTLVITSGDGIATGITTGNIRNSGTRTFSIGVNYNFTNNDTILPISSNMGTAFTIVSPATSPEISSINNLTVNNPLNVIAPVNINVSGVLTFISGNIVMGSNSITIGTSGSIVGAGIGWVVGNLIKQTSSGSNPSFNFAIGEATKYTPVAVIFSSNNTASTTGSIAASTTLGDSTAIANSGLDSAKSVNRTWTLTNNGITGFTNYDASFTYANSDNDSAATSANYAIRNFENTSWFAPSIVGVPTNTNTIASGITGFGDFAIAETTGLPAIVTQPINSTICTGSNTSFIVATNSSLTYAIKWKRSADGIQWDDVTANLDAGTIYSGFNSETLTLTGSNNTINSYQYKAICTTINGATVSNIAVLSVVTTNAPTASAQSFCVSGTVANLVAIGTNIKWFTGATDNLPLNSNDALATGTYFVSQTENSCESTRVAISITVNPQPAQPTLACYQSAIFNTTTCSWDVTGTQPVQPTLACYQSAIFNTTTCSWDVTGTQPVQPTLACYQSATFNTTTCSWNVTGTQPVQPTLACYQSATFNTTTCSWNVTGTQPVQPILACYQSATFNTTTCTWNVTGTQPIQPTLACYQTATFNTTSCSWNVTGTQPVQPTLACYQTATFNSTTCSWNVTGTQPVQPTLACYQTATFNTTTCSWNVTGTQPVQPTLACYQSATFNTTTCSWDVTGTPIPTPTGAASQSLTLGQTLASVIVTGNNIVWYGSLLDAQNHSNALNISTILINGTTYYATQTINGCTSTTPLAVLVNVTLTNADFDIIDLEYYPNPVVNNLNLSYSKDIDSVTIYNLLGQKIKFIQPNTTFVQIDMSTLPEGTYILQIESNGKQKVIKVSK